MTKRVAVVLAGCGVFDGSEVHEASAVLVHLSREGAQVRGTGSILPRLPLLFPAPFSCSPSFSRLLFPAPAPFSCSRSFSRLCSLTSPLLLSETNAKLPKNQAAPLDTLGMVWRTPCPAVVFRRLCIQTLQKTFLDAFSPCFCLAHPPSSPAVSV